MSEERYRAGIDAKKIKEWHVEPGGRSGQWYSDYGSKSDVAQSLAEVIKKDLRKFRAYQPEHGSGKSPEQRLVSAEVRNRVVRKALLLLAKEF